MKLNTTGIPSDYDPEIENGVEQSRTYREDLSTIASAITQIVNAEDSKPIQITVRPTEVSLDVIERSIQGLNGLIKGVKFFESLTGHQLQSKHHQQIVLETAITLGQAFRTNSALIPISSGAILQVVFMSIESPKQNGEEREIYPGFLIPIFNSSGARYISSFAIEIGVPGTDKNLLRVGVGFSENFAKINYPPKKR